MFTGGTTGSTWRTAGVWAPCNVERVGPRRQADRWPMAVLAFVSGAGFHVKIGVEKTRRQSVEDPLQNFNRTRILATVTVGS